MPAPGIWPILIVLAIVVGLILSRVRRENLASAVGVTVLVLVFGYYIGGCWMLFRMH
jgi:hypothetical protein